MPNLDLEAINRTTLDYLLKSPGYLEAAITAILHSEDAEASLDFLKSACEQRGIDFGGAMMRAFEMNTQRLARYFSGDDHVAPGEMKLPFRYG